MFKRLLFCLAIAFSLSGCAGSYNTTQSVFDQDVQGLIRSEDVDGIDFGDESKVPPLHKACNSSHIDIDEIRRLVAAGEDINATYSFELNNLDYHRNSITPLGVACSRSDIDEKAVRVLVELGADVNAPSNYRTTKGNVYRTFTPIMAAVNRSKVDNDALKVLIQLGAQINAQDDKKRTPVMIAAEHLFDPKTIHILLDAGANVDIPDEDGHVLVHLVIRDLELTKRVVSLSTDIHKKDDKKNDALLLASAFGPPEVITYLLGLGFDIHAQTKNEEGTAMLAACDNGFDTFKTLIDAGARLDVADDKYTHLICACQKKQWDDRVQVPQKKIVQYLIENGPDVNTVSTYGDTALSQAAANIVDTTEIMQMLLDAGADIHLTSKTGNAMSWVKNAENAKFLIKKGIDVDVEGETGFTPLLNVVTQDEDMSELVTVLLDAGADINHQTQKGSTALMLVHNPNVARLLIARGADINMTDEDGDTALHWAANKMRLEHVKALVEAGADVNKPNNKGVPPIWQARTPEIIDYLAQHGASLKRIIKHYQDGEGNPLPDKTYEVSVLGKYFTDYAQTPNTALNRFEKGQLLLAFLRNGARPDQDSLHIEDLNDYLSFDSQNDRKELAKLYLSKELINKGGYGMHDESIMSATLKSKTLNGVQYSPTPEWIKEMLDMGAYVPYNALALYLDNPSVTPNMDVLRMLANSSTVQHESQERDGWRIPVVIKILDRAPQFFPEILKFNPDANARKVKHYVGYRVYCTDGSERETWEITYGETALMTAVKDPKNVKVLLDLHADPNIGTDDFVTPLMIAAEEGQLESAELLIKAGATVNEVDVNGKSVLQYSRTDEMADLLKKHGAKLNPGIKHEKPKLAPMPSCSPAPRPKYRK
ncbi:MAG: ankyrin repeat domain-containing protein [Proteobacteria bacterium]|nr:ankyrin repeat domain-containing protein [Pseudomonadota bacterium]